MKKIILALLILFLVGGCTSTIKGHNFAPQIWIPEEPSDIPDYRYIALTHNGEKGIWLPMKSIEIVITSVKDWQYVFRTLKKTVETYNKWADRQIQESEND